MKTLVRSMLMLLASGVAGNVFAHHSFAAAYDMSASIKVTGKIVDVRLTNPHSWFFIDVENENGEVERWSFEAGTPSGMIRNGYSPNVIRTGDIVTISGFHARDPSANSGMLRELVTADGTVYGLFGPRESAGAR